MSHFPPEIYLAIFDFATYTHHVHDPDPLDMNFQLFVTKNYRGSLRRSLVPFCYSWVCLSHAHPSQRTKLSLVRVCRAWMELAYPFLYENIVIGRGRYLLSICSVLRENRSLGHCTKRLDIALRDSARPVDEELSLIADIIRFLPNLEIVTFSVSSAPYTRDDYSPHLALDALSSTCAHSLRYIHWFRETLVPEAGDLYALLRKTPNLRSFRTPLVAVGQSKQPSHGEFFHSSIVAVHAEYSTPDLDTPISPQLMNFPSLRQLSLSVSLSVDPRWGQFLQAHGNYLQHIQVLVHHVGSFMQSDLTCIIASCPNLVRLDFNFSYWSHFPPLVTLPPTVQTLGIFCAQGQDQSYSPFFSRLNSIEFGENFRCIQFLGKRNVADMVGKHRHQFIVGTECLRRRGIRFMDHREAYLA